MYSHQVPIRRGSQPVPVGRHLEASNITSCIAGIRPRRDRARRREWVARIEPTLNITETTQKRFRGQFHSPFDQMIQRPREDKALCTELFLETQVQGVSRGCHQHAAQSVYLNTVCRNGQISDRPPPTAVPMFEMPDSQIAEVFVAEGYPGSNCLAPLEVQ